MKRSKHSLSNYKLLTGDMGRLIPVGLVETLPGDTFQQSTSALIRMSPLIAPVMHPVSVRIHHWFVPHRLTFPDWEKFITGGKDGEGDGSVFPVTAAPVTPAKGDLWDYMGVLPGVAHVTGSLSLLPIRAYNKIYNEFYRDEDVVTEVAEDQEDTQLVSWEKDYFTTARPWTQKGPAVSIPLGAQAPVILDPTNTNYGRTLKPSDHTVDNLTSPISQETGTGRLHLSGDTGRTLVYDPQDSLIADLANAISPEVIEFRRAFALQRYQEARA